MENIPDSGEFCTGVVEAFDFLVVRHNFVLSEIGEGGVAFAKDDLKVDVLRESMSLMIYVRVSCANTGEVFVLHEILKALVPEKRPIAQWSGRGSVSILHCLNHLSENCQQNLHSILSGDKAALQLVSSSARKEREAFTLECQYGQTRDRANLAWDRKEWVVAQRLYEESRPILSITERRRLDFLNSRQGQ